ncbi:MAG: M28 family peptidase [Planctomycetes bacterium]|nr:M28 family peptidase [Planctomycetota bacterium]
MTLTCFAVVLETFLAGCANPTAQRFQTHVNYLASDELEGRGVGTPGIELAADYVARQFAEIGLEPAGDNGTYFQSFPMTLRRKLTDAGRLALEGDKEERRQERDFVPLSFSSDEAFSGDVVFCGYGIVAPDKDRDDFVHADVKGNVAFMLRGEPPSWTQADGTHTPHAMFRNKVYNAKDRGAVAVLLVNLTPAEGEKDELIAFETRGADNFGIPAFHVTRAFADVMLAAGGRGTLAAIQEKLDAGGYASAALAGVKVSGQAGFQTESAPTRNVLGLLRGHGALADEYVVVGAHYDHLGKVKPMMRRFKGGKLVADDGAPQIHNGADDNASGVGGVIETARLFAGGERPQRSVLFVAFTAEESGLHGSKHYVEHPTVPLEKTALMLNFDMIGRLSPVGGKLEVFGAKCGAEFMDVLTPLARRQGIALAPTPDDGGRSDHVSFVRKRVPAMHFFTGQHLDYHKPSDDADKINARGAAKIIQLAYDAAREFANRTARPTFQEVKASAPEKGGDMPSYRVVMGLAPGYGDDGKPGMAVEAVNAEGPADMAGMKAGDRIIRIDGKNVANIYDYMAATRNNKPGDTVEVVVLRGDNELTLKVTLASAK